jgi:hypothetical protein
VNAEKPPAPADSLPSSTSQAPPPVSSSAQAAFDLALPQTLIFSPASIDYRFGGSSTTLAWSSLCYSETRNLFVAYLFSNSFSFLPRRLRSLLPAFVLMSSGYIQVIPIPKRSFVCIPDQNYVRDLLYTQSLAA